LDFIVFCTKIITRQYLFLFLVLTDNTSILRVLIRPFTWFGKSSCNPNVCNKFNTYKVCCRRWTIHWFQKLKNTILNIFFKLILSYTQSVPVGTIRVCEKKKENMKKLNEEATHWWHFIILLKINLNITYNLFSNYLYLFRV